MDTVQALMKYYGMKEVAGKGSNPTILNWINNSGFPWVADDSALPWCSIGLKVILEEAGFDVEKATAMARSWLGVGEPLKLPEYGSVAVIYRGSNDDGRTGHATIFLNDDFTYSGKYFLGLGCNQNDSVKISRYPYSKLLGCQKIKLFENNC